MKELFKEYVSRVLVSKGEHYLLVYSGRETLALYEATGDCCSESWFADIVGIDNLKNAVVIGIKVLNVELPEGDTRTRQEYDEVYGYRLTTHKGDCDIIFRNSSNGYYGGELTQVSDPKQVEEILSSEVFVEITENDWQA